MANHYFGRLMLDLQGPTLSPAEAQLLRNPDVGGVILFSRNLTSRDQLIDLVADVRKAAPQLLIAVDQEGGRVQRFRDGFTPLPAMQVLGDMTADQPDKGLALARDVGWLMAAEIIACGLDISFAPVLDIDRCTSSIIGDRAFADQPQLVIEVARAFIAGMGEAGMRATGKHFPGHGGIAADSHLEAPVDTRTFDQLKNRDMQPFIQLSEQLGGIMPAHITYPEVDSLPVGFSAFWLQQVLRRQLGFQGVIFSDDLSMKGADIAGSYADKARLALSAGCDMILVCNNPQGAREVLEFMAQNPVEPSEKIGLMQASKVLDWNQLIDKRRYRDIKNRLKDVV
ncbi:MAG: beta-N-acetylhexosaminidase [Porticoccaceae bacterium]